MKRLTSLIVAITVGLIIGLNALTITVGTTMETVSLYPIHTQRSYNYTQQIYTQSQINQQGEISKIRFFRHHSGELDNSHNWMVYMGHTARVFFPNTWECVPVDSLTQVFSGSLLDNFPDPGQWMEITLDTPFSYNNSNNLLVAVYENTPDYSETVMWAGFDSGNYRGLYYGSNSIDPDVNAPPHANQRSRRIASIQFVFTDTEAPVAPALVFPENYATIVNGQALEWALPTGTADVTGYDVYIDGTLVSDNQVSNQYLLTDLESGPHTWHVVARNDIGSSPPSATGNFTIATGLIIGDGTMEGVLPVYAYQDYSYTQSIFLQSEINISNQRIERIAYYWNGAGVGTNTSDWKVYMGHVQRSGFDSMSDWVPVSHMIQVFDGHLNIPATPGWIEIELDTPFVYNNMDNLVIAVDENTPNHDGNNQRFYSTPTPDQYRSIHYYYGGSNPDPASPPNGFLQPAYPNIMIKFGDLPTSPVLEVIPPGLNFGTVIYGQPNEPLTVMASNMGGGTINLTAADVSLIGQNAAEFSFDPANLPATLGSGQYVFIPVTVTGFTTGQVSATLRIIYDGQNHDVHLTAVVSPVNTIMIGNGTQAQGYPFGTLWGFERSASLYTADQIGIVGTLDMVAWDCATPANINIPYKIWAKNTTETALTPQTWQSFTAGATLLKEGTFTPNTSGWKSFQLDTPFSYTGSGLIIAIESNYGGSGIESDHSFRYTNLGTQRHQVWRYDNIEPTGNGWIYADIPNIMMHIATDVEDDLCAINISGSLTPTVGQETSYTVRIRNNGSINQSNYQVKLMGPNNAQLAVVNGPPINSGMTADVEFLWTPTVVGPTTLCGKVELDGDEVAINNQTAPVAVDVQPAGVVAVTIGSGDELARIPMDFWARNSLYETLYLSDELGFTTGTITSIAFFNQFNNNVDIGATKVFLGSTTQNDLSGGFIPATELTMVYDGDICYPSGNNTILIDLQTPYMHSGGNLVMMMNRPMNAPSYSSGENFRCQTIGNNRARNISSGGITIDPYDPPEGLLTGQFPKTTFYYTSTLIENDLGVVTITGNTCPTVGVPSTYTVRLRNHGIEAQDTYTVKLVDSNNVQLASVAGPPIQSQQTVEVELPWTPTTQGNCAIYGKVEMAGDQISNNNFTRPLNLVVSPAGVLALTVGDGSESARIPIDMLYRHFLFQSLYFPDEIGGSIGRITGLRFYNQFNSNLDEIPISIWLGTTTQNSLVEGFISPMELTLVYDGPVDLPSGDNIIDIAFDEPFLFLGDTNLVVLVYKNNTNPLPQTNCFKCQTVGASRSRKASSFHANFDLTNTSLGTPTGQFPMTTFVTVPGGVGQIYGTVTGANNQPLSGVAVSLNDGEYYTTTNASGQYQLTNVFTQAYTLSFSVHGYHEHTQTLVIESDDELTIDVTLQLLPQVSVTGTILASDSGEGIPDVLITLSGYEPYSTNTNAAGVFTFPNVFAGHTYDYSIRARDYTPISGQVTIGNTNHDMGQINLIEIPYAPMSVTAAVNDIGNAVNIAWLAPDPDAMEVVESFEDTEFPPTGWTQTITNESAPNAAGIYPTWCRIATVTVLDETITPTEGCFQAGLHWDYNHQDEWLITPSLNCPPIAYLSFDTHAYFGSVDGDHHYVKISTDNGTTWTVLWDASEQTGGWNRYSSPVTVDLSAYSGEQIKIAFHAEDPPDNAGLRYSWYIDNVYIGYGSVRLQLDLDGFTRVSADGTQRRAFGNLPLRAMSRRAKEGNIRAEPSASRPNEGDLAHRSPRVLTGYMAYRLQAEQEQNEGTWEVLTSEPTNALSLTDSGWDALPNGSYLWAIKAIYTNGVTSVASFSNIINKHAITGIIAGTVRRENATGIAGATVTNGTETTTTNSMGAYTLIVPVGCHSVTASAAGYADLTVDDVPVNQDLTTTVNFILEEVSNDDNLLPVAVTALNGNYPNPFNPETTISYSVKEPGKVKLEVYNIKGQLVRTLVDEEQVTGHYKLIFDARDDSGRPISSGVYMLKMIAPGYRKTSKMILMQ
ncbi:MAG: carboxypeptidase regulatory-like domain-containing protein [Candidatus Cloacimonadaceae bacterium]|jgi:hypothetical protein